MDTTTDRDYGAALRRMRRAAALTQRQLAVRSGVPAENIAAAEQGIAVLLRAQHERIADAVGHDAADAETLDALASRLRVEAARARINAPGAQRPARRFPPVPVLGDPVHIRGERFEYLRAPATTLGPSIVEGDAVWTVVIPTERGNFTLTVPRDSCSFPTQAAIALQCLVADYRRTLRAESVPE